MHVITYFDAAYLPKGVVMLRSLLRHNPEARAWVVACDRRTREALTSFHPQVTAVPLSEVEDEALRDARATRSWVEYLWTLTPTVMRWALATYHLPEIAYADADLWFAGKLAPLYAEVAPYAIAAIPHRWTPKYAERLSQNGKYNVGWLRVADAPAGRAFLEAWRDLCNRWCYNRVEAGKMGDQGYLDALMPRFGGHDVANPAANLAPWSQEQYAYQVLPSGRLAVSGSPLLFYHFHELRHTPQGAVIQRTGYPLHPLVVKYCYEPYEKELADACRQFVDH